jgi:hypothetical protein
MIFICKDIQKHSKYFSSVIARLDRATQKKDLDYPVCPDNDNLLERVHYERL